MKKQKDSESQEIVSLNQELFSLEAGNLSVEELDQRLELALAAIERLVCGTFTCARYGTCGELSCGTFKVY